MKPREFVKPFRVADGSHFRLKDIDPADTLGVKSKEQAKETLERGVARLAALQEKLYAQDRWAILVVLQGMDAAGKDSTVKHVMSGVNPQGCQVNAFKAPSNEELQHDFLWRTSRCLPERGKIGIFNRSYYEEVLVVRVHPELLAHERIPTQLELDNIWQKRF
jgi:polyphosphate kinase 2 (PPK2 family)